MRNILFHRKVYLLRYYIHKMFKSKEALKALFLLN